MNIRKMKIEDAPLLLDFFRNLVAEDQERVERLSDVAKVSLENEEKWIQERIQKEGTKELFARIVTDEKKIIAEGEIERMKRWIERHVAELRFGVIPGHTPAARELVGKLIEIAKENGIEVLFYFHLETQKTGIGIVREAGFYEVGRMKRYYKRGSSYCDRVYMALTL